MFSIRSRASSTARYAAASVVAVAVAAPLSGALAAHAAGARPAASTAVSPARVDLRSTSLGKLLVNGGGFTLYVFSRDRRDKDRCVATQGCTGVWPPLTTHGRAVAGRGVRASLLGSIDLSDGAHQVTYDGHPLYTYAFDSGPGQTGYVDATEFGGVWRALAASGRTVG